MGHSGCWKLTHESNHPQLSDLELKGFLYQSVFGNKVRFRKGLISIWAEFFKTKTPANISAEGYFCHSLLNKNWGKFTICMNHPCGAALGYLVLHDSLRLVYLFCRSQQRVSLPPKRHKDAATRQKLGVGVYTYIPTQSEHAGKNTIICKPAFSRWFLEFVFVLFFHPEALGTGPICVKVHIFFENWSGTIHDSCISIILFSCISGFRWPRCIFVLCQPSANGTEPAIEVHNMLGYNDESLDLQSTTDYFSKAGNLWQSALQTTNFQRWEMWVSRWVITVYLRKLYPYLVNSDVFFVVGWRFVEKTVFVQQISRWSCLLNSFLHGRAKIGNHLPNFFSTRKGLKAFITWFQNILPVERIWKFFFLTHPQKLANGPSKIQVWKMLLMVLKSHAQPPFGMLNTKT